MVRNETMKIKNRIVPVVVMLIFVLTVAVPVHAGAEEVRISSIDDSYIGKEVTVSGVIVTIASNIEPSTEKDEGIQTYEPGDTSIFTIDDGTDTILVSTDPRLLEQFYKGLRVIVTGIYAGTGGIEDGKGIIYAYTVNADVSLEYEDVTVKELKDFPEFYHARSVRIQGTVARLEFTSGETRLEIDDPTGTIEVVYRAEMKNISIGDEVIVEGKLYYSKIYAFAVRTTMPEPEETPEPSPSPSPSPSPTTTPAPTATPSSTPPPSPVTEEEEGMPIYLIAIIIAVVAVVGIVVSFKLRELLMLRRYGK